MTDVAAMEKMDLPTHLGLENADYSRALAYVNGEIGPLGDAKISILDLGLSKPTWFSMFCMYGREASFVFRTTLIDLINRLP